MILPPAVKLRRSPRFFIALNQSVWFDCRIGDTLSQHQPESEPPDLVTIEAVGGLESIVRAPSGFNNGTTVMVRPIEMRHPHQGYFEEGHLWIGDFVDAKTMRAYRSAIIVGDNVAEVEPMEHYLLVQAAAFDPSDKSEQGEEKRHNFVLLEQLILNLHADRMNGIDNIAP